MNDNLNHIYFTEKFKYDITCRYKSIRLSSFRLGEYSSSVLREDKFPDGTHTGIKYINYDYMSKFVTLSNGKTASDRVHPSISESPFNLDGIYDYESSLLYLYILPINGKGDLEEEIYDNSIYKIIYVLYKDLLTQKEDLAFIIYNEDIEINSPVIELLPLNLSKYNNLITIKIPMECEVITYMDRDTDHLESPGVNFFNYFSLKNDQYRNSYVSKSSFTRHYLNSISSGTPMIGCNSINKFGLKLY